MMEEHDLICVFEGSVVDVTYYQERLEENNIQSMIKDNFSAGIHGGFPGASGGAPDSIQLFVEAHDAEMAVKYIEDLQKENL